MSIYIYPKLYNFSYFNDHYEETENKLIYKIKYPNMLETRL